VKRGLFALMCLVCMAGWLASTAAACHSEVSATIDCSGKVSYTATAWNSSSASTASRTNADVRVWASYDNGGSYSQVGNGHFGPDNGFSFAGSFSAGNASSVMLKVQEVSRWGSGDSPGAPHYVNVAKQGCAPPPPTCPSSGMVKSGPIAVSGATASVTFTVAAGCQNIQLSLVSYKAPSATFDEQTADQQQLFDSKTQTFSAGQYTLSVAMPGCYFQVDFVYGTPITKLGPAGTNNFYGKQGRLIAAANGGTTSCSPPATPPPPTTPPPTTPPPATPPPTTPPPTTTSPEPTPEPTAVALATSTSVQTKAVPKQTVVKKVVKKKVAHKHTVKRTKHTKQAKKVTKKAKPARPVVAQAHFTG
jgi:hypothetical protein